MADSVQRVPVQERAQRTRAALLVSAERLFASRGYAATTAKSIASEAGVATGSFYQYFTGKDAALHELAAARLTQLLEQAHAKADALPTSALLDAESSALEAALRGTVELVLNLHQNDIGLHAVLTERCLVDPEMARIAAEADRTMLALIIRLLKALPHVADVEACALVIFGMIEGTVHKQVFGQTGVADERVVTALTSAVLRTTSIQMPPHLSAQTGGFP